MANNGPSGPEQGGPSEQETPSTPSAELDSGEAVAPPQKPNEDFEYRILMSEYSQMDPKWGFEPGSERSMCGIICLKASLDHYAYRVGGDGPRPREIFEDIQEQHGWDSNIGITHAAEIAELQKDHHPRLVAWRRDWERPETEPQELPNHGGYNAEQLEAVNAQIASETGLSPREQQRQAIIDSLMPGSENPVIASVGPGFSGNAAQHQVLVIGWSSRNGQEKVTVMDPELENRNIHDEPADRFFEFFKQRAIFMKPRPAA